MGDTAERSEVNESGRMEVAPSGGEKEEHRVRTHDRTPPLRNGFQTFQRPPHPEERPCGGWGVQVRVLEGDQGTEAEPVGWEPSAEPGS